MKVMLTKRIVFIWAVLFLLWLLPIVILKVVDFLLFQDFGMAIHFALLDLGGIASIPVSLLLMPIMVTCINLLDGYGVCGTMESVDLLIWFVYFLLGGGFSYLVALLFGRKSTGITFLMRVILILISLRYSVGYLMSLVFIFLGNEKVVEFTSRADQITQSISALVFCVSWFLFALMMISKRKMALPVGISLFYLKIFGLALSMFKGEANPYALLGMAIPSMLLYAIMIVLISIMYKSLGWQRYEWRQLGSYVLFGVLMIQILYWVERVIDGNNNMMLFTGSAAVLLLLVNILLILALGILILFKKRHWVFWISSFFVVEKVIETLLKLLPKFSRVQNGQESEYFIFFIIIPIIFYVIIWVASLLLVREQDSNYVKLGNMARV